MYNPFDGVKPGLGPFQAVLGGKVAIIIGVVWAGCFIYAAVHLLQAVAGVAAARKHNRIDANEKAWACVAPGAAIIGLSAIGIIYGALVAS